MFHSHAMEHRINRIHKRTLKLIYPNQRQLTFKELLEKSKTVSIHHRSLQTLLNEIYKTKNKICREVVNSLFEFNKNYNLRNMSILKRKRYLQSIMKVKVFYLSSENTWIWKTCSRFNQFKSIFKNKIEAWTTDTCPWRLCKII